MNLLINDEVVDYRKLSAQNTKPRILLRYGISVVDPYYPHTKVEGFWILNRRFVTPAYFEISTIDF